MNAVHWPSFWLGLFAPTMVFLLVCIVVGLIGELLTLLDRAFYRLTTPPPVRCNLCGGSQSPVLDDGVCLACRETVPEVVR